MSFAAVISLLVLAAAPNTIGIGASPGAFRIAGAAVIQTASIQEGAAIETALAPLKVMLGSGARVELAPNSRARVYGDRVVLEAGRSRVTGPLAVKNAEGVLLAQVMPNRALDFALAAMSTATVRISGLLERQEDQFWMTDDLTKVRFQLAGTGDVEKALEESVGKKAEIEGRITKDLIETARVTQLSTTVVAATSAAVTGTAVTAAVASSKAAAGAAATAAGIGSKAVIAGVAISGAVGGTTLGVVQASSQSQTASQ